LIASDRDFGKAISELRSNDKEVIIIFKDGASSEIIKNLVDVYISWDQICSIPTLQMNNNNLNSNNNISNNIGLVNIQNTSNNNSNSLMVGSLNNSINLNPQLSNNNNLDFRKWIWLPKIL